MQCAVVFECENLRFCSFYSSFLGKSVVVVSGSSSKNNCCDRPSRFFTDLAGVLEVWEAFERLAPTMALGEQADCEGVMIFLLKKYCRKGLPY